MNPTNGNPAGGTSGTVRRPLVSIRRMKKGFWDLSILSVAGEFFYDAIQHTE